MGGLFKKFVEWGTECHYVPLGTRCGACDKKIGFFASGFWSINSKYRHLSDGVLCEKCHEKTEKLVKEKNGWMSKEVRRMDEWKRFDNTMMANYSVADIKNLFRQKEVCDHEILSSYGEGACGIFRIKKSFLIEPDMFDVGVARAKRFENKTVVFGTVDEGVFEKGNRVKFDFNETFIETWVLEAFALDDDDRRNLRVAFEETLRANLSHTRKIKENKSGWLVLDTNLLDVAWGDRVIQYTK